MNAPRPDADEPARFDEALRWALESTHDPALASADWLAMDIDPTRTSAFALLTDPSVPLTKLRQAKDAYKTMRIVGETSSDRRLGARLYGTAIAAAIVRHGKRITRQSDAALRRSFHGLLDDADMPEAVRALAGQALCQLDAGGPGVDATESKSTQSRNDVPRDASNSEAAPTSDAATPHTEIERTYVLSGVPDLPQHAERLIIEQGYLPAGMAAGPLSEGRLRRATGPGGRVVLTHTIKTGTGLERTEIEQTIDRADFDRVWPSTWGRRIVKTRYRVLDRESHPPVTWEIDVFEDRALVLAEVELPTAETVVLPPDWLADHIVRDVTEEVEYRNYVLATGEKPR
ncbi:MAG: hypothetical protein HKO59_02700 [Phycisphaerales bacterium]|nr:hypothetical protein [Phycisphaerales bacterium]NNM24891.1 hypothetical protein [Phycisphaerales bacterium]